MSPVFSEASRPLFSAEPDEVAYGFGIRPSSKGGTYYAKPGSTAGYSAVILWRVKPRIGVVVLANRGHFELVNQIGSNLIESAVNSSRR